MATFTILTGLGFVASTLLFLPNRWPLILAGPVLLWLLGYSFAKRFTSLAHFWLGFALAMAPMAAWIALREDRLAPRRCWGWRSCSGWPGSTSSTPARMPSSTATRACTASPDGWASGGRLRLASACHAAMVGALVGLGLAYPMGAIYFAGVGVVALLAGSTSMRSSAPTT